MINPDVWTLDPPPTFITHKYGQLTNNSIKEIEQKIVSHNFNEILSIVLPDTKVLPENISKLFKDSDHYIVENISADELIDRVFIEAFIKRGLFYGLSIDTRIDIDDSIAITPNKILHLSLCKELYQSLGLEGHVSKFAQKHSQKYIIEINLDSAELVHGTKYYARVKAALSHKVLPKFSMRIQWQSIDNTVCSSSIAKYFVDKQYKCTLVGTTMKAHQEYRLKMPEIGKDDNEQQQLCIGKELYASPHEIIEYLGMLTLGCSRDTDSYLNSYQCYGRSIEMGQAKVAKWSGMFMTSTILKLLNELKEFVQSQRQIPWVSLYCQGFKQSPISFNGKEHNFRTNGDNAYAILITPDMNYLWYQIEASNKKEK